MDTMLSHIEAGLEEEEGNRRILIVDDNASIHEDFAKILPNQPDEFADFDELEQDLFGAAEMAGQAETSTPVYYDLSHAYQGQEAFELVEKAETEGWPFSVLFVDIRMPPGWDGIETIKRIWERWPHLEMVICTAYSDYSWEKILKQIGQTDQLMFLRKPFDVISVKQMALALTKKWNLAAKSRSYVRDLEKEVTRRTRTLDEKVKALELALAEIRDLQSILPMCVHCKKIRDDKNFWQRVEDYIQKSGIANISQSVCPQCYDSAMSIMLQEINQEDD